MFPRSVHISPNTFPHSDICLMRYAGNKRRNLCWPSCEVSIFVFDFNQSLNASINISDVTVVCGQRTDGHGIANERILQLFINNAPRKTQHEFPDEDSNTISLSTGDVTYSGPRMHGE